MKKTAKGILKSQSADLLFGSNDKESEPIVILLTNDFLIREINQSGSIEFFQNNKCCLINKSLIDLLIEQQINTTAWVKAFKLSKTVLCQSIKIEHSRLRKKYSVTIIRIDENNQTYYAITLIATNEDYRTLKSYVNDIINNLPGAVYWKDREGRYMGCNKFVAKMAGFNSPEEMIGKTDYDLCWHEFADDWRVLDIKVIQDNATIVREETAKLANGTIITELTFKTPLKNEYDEIVGVIGTSLDITDRKVMEKALYESQIAAESANHAKTEFIANMSHDIRTPLTGVVGMSKMLEDNAVDPNQKKYAHWLLESGDQLLHMLNGILDVVSVDNANDNDLREDSFDLRRVIHDIVELERPSTQVKGIDLITHIDERIPFCLISDHTKLHRILLNLIGNAIKFTQIGYVMIDITFLEQHNKNVLLRFRVSDTGIGIPPDMQNMVFDRFFRVTPSYKGIYTGHGIGLHIAQSYAHLLGGEIMLSSVLGVGSTFYFNLSIKIDNATQFSHLATEPSIEESTVNYHPLPQTLLNIAMNPSHNTPNLLLIEDNLIALRVLEDIVTQSGCSFTSSMDGEAALKLASNNTFDLIITDLGLPNLSGIDLTKKIREIESSMSRKSTPIIGLTAHAEDKVRDECLASGMNAVFSKPMDLNILSTITINYLSGLPISPTANNIATSQNRYTSLGFDLPDTEQALFELDIFPVFDEQLALEQMGHNQVFLFEVLKDFIEKQIPDDIALIENAYTQKDWDLLEKLAHKMKGGVLYCGTIKMKYACQYLERYRKAGHFTQLDPLYYQLIQVTEETRLSVSNWLNKQSNKC